jgi:uncharacterized protein YdaU (DUF1376 family)
MTKESKLAMMPWWPADFIASSRCMSLAERGAFRDLLDAQWINGGLPNDPVLLARTLGVAEGEFRALWPAFREHFVKDPNNPKRLINERLERERAHSIEMRTNASAKAKHAADTRWTNAPRNAPSIMPEALLEHCPPAQASAQASAESQSPPPAYIQSKARTPVIAQDVQHKGWMAVRHAYPARTFTNAEWGKAKGYASKLVRDNRVTWDSLRIAVCNYAKHCASIAHATAAAGERVALLARIEPMSVVDFFGSSDEHWSNVWGSASARSDRESGDAHARPNGLGK